MPKMKTHSGAKKRFRVTGQRQGHARAGRRPPPARAQVLAEDPSPSRKRPDACPQPDAKKIKKLLGK